MKESRYSYLLVSSLVLWFGFTCFIDFKVVPTVFRESTNLFDGARIGIQVFSSFNYIELVLALLILLSVWKLKRNKIEYILSTILLFIGSFYLLYLSPKISLHGLKLENLGEGGIDHDELFDFYHSLYIKTDSVKLILLFAMILLVCKNIMKQPEKII